jgi:hypothetical protein
VCKESIAVLKHYNLSRHFQTKHAEKYRNVFRAEGKCIEIVAFPVAKAARTFNKTAFSKQLKLEIANERKMKGKYVDFNGAFSCCFEDFKVLENDMLLNPLLLLSMWITLPLTCNLSLSIFSLMQ